MRLIKTFLIAILILAIVWFWYRYAISPVSATDARRIPFSIESGQSVSHIADRLKEEQLIRSSLAFTVYAKLNDLESRLQAGDYVLRPSDNVPMILEALLSGKSTEESMTIPEGFTIAQIDKLLAAKGFGEPGDVINCAFTCDFSSFEFLPAENAGEKERGYGSRLEGYLFPDTYFIARDNYKEKFFLERLLTTFRNRVVNELDDDIENANRTLHDIVTMASLVEEETRSADERQIVSGILWKRFDANTGLGVDATVRYVLSNIADPLTVEDLEVRSPYNTRKFRGLPPGPIANPGIASVKAAIFPEESVYWYYLHGSDGKIRYAETNDEHNVNKARYLK